MEENKHKVIDRKDVDLKYKWDLSDIYKNYDEAIEDTKKAIEISKEIKALEGKLGNIESYVKMHKLSEKIGEIGEKVNSYCFLNYSLDMKNTEVEKNNNKIDLMWEEISDNCRYISNEEKELPDEYLLNLANVEGLHNYKRDFEDLVRFKKYMLSKKEEELLSKMGRASGMSDVYDLLTNLEMDFNDVKDKDGNKLKMDDSSYSKYLSSQDRVLRKNAFESMYRQYKLHNSSISTMYLAMAKKWAEVLKIRGYKGALESKVLGESTVKVYDTLVKSVNDNIDINHDIIKFKKEVSGLSDYALYDTYINSFESKDAEDIDFKDARKEVIDALNVMGDEYITVLNKAFDNRWIDVYKGENKESGAYNLGVDGVHPYVLLNYVGKPDDVSTIAHELGHAMHSYYSDKYQENGTKGYTIMVAEVASTVNEILLAEYKLKTETNIENKKAILFDLIDRIRATLIRQTMFAEFERYVHESTWNKVPLTKDDLNEKYLTLVKHYFGKDIEINDEIKYEWSRIPHFYRPYYVYTYATGITAATYISKNILERKEEYREKYINMLKSGSKYNSLDTLKIAEVDLEDENVYNQVFEYLNEKLIELKNLCD